MGQLKKQLLAALPDPIRRYVAPDSRAELLQGISATLLLFEQALVHLESGDQEGIEEQDAAGLAAAAAGLLGPDHEGAIALLLPPGEFVSTPCILPGVTPDNLESAMALQQEELLPACDQDLAMAVNPDSATLGEEHVALWLPRTQLDGLFDAFAARGMFLAAVKPRLLVATGDAPEVRIIDSDSNATTAAALNQGVNMQWLQVQQPDLEQEPFQEQWQQELKSYPTARSVCLAGTADYLAQGDAADHRHYWFFPTAALVARRQVERGRKLALAGVAAAALAVFAALPFLWQSVEYRRGAATLAATRELSAEARADQAVVAGFENEWGPVNDFPEQDLREAMFTLQEAISPDRLSSLEASEGLISIQGTSDDPQAILQRLEQNPLFTEVAFARATNNTRYYIDLRLSPVNFEGYWLRYFPDR